MYGDTRTAAHDVFVSFSAQRSELDSFVPWSQRAKVLLWTSLGITSWAAVILTGYFAWSAL
jgi:hypothetical protein